MKTRGAFKPLFFFKVFCFCLFASLSFFSTADAVQFTKEYLDTISKQYGDYAKRRLIGWEKLTIENKNLDEKEKLEKVNQFFNLLEYRRNIDHWGVENYWATPLEFVVSGAGDCENFSTAKYFALRELDVPDEKLLLMYVKYTGDGKDQAHMVLLYYPTPSSVPLVLDNINKEILPADQRPDLKPIYGFNGMGLWQAKELSKGNKIGSASDLKRWVDLEGRIKSGKISQWIEGNR